jgi:CDP-paratose 2-epimerase
VRDVLEVRDAVDAYIAAWRRIDRVTGRAFNLGGGPANAVSLRTLIDHIGALVGTEPDIHFDDWREGDQRYFVADTRVARKAFALAAPMPWRAGVARLARWLASERGLDIKLGAPRPVMPQQAVAL